MRKLMIVLLIFVMVFSVNTTVGAAEATEIIVPDTLEVTKAFDQAIQEIIDTKKAKGATATLIINGDVTMTKGYGYADELLNLKTDGERIGFRIGSISKTFVAVAALIAMEDGKIDLDIDISQYLPKDFPKFKYPVTMKNLLTHTAGFEEQITGMAVKNVSDTEPLSVSVVKHMPAQIFEPNDTASYSNYGIALAAYVIENATGEDFADYCEKKIFQPLSMDRTTFAFMQDTVYVSKAYLPNGEETMDVYMNLYPEGSAISTAEDMAKYIEWLLSDDDVLLGKANKEQLFIKQYAMSDAFEGIGYVWNRKIRNGTIYYDKKGETLHFYSKVVLYPEHKSGLFLSFNTYVSDEDIDALIARVSDLLLGEKERITPQSGGTMDIAGHYANAWSSFRTPEKILRLFIPSKMVDISGSLTNGYTFEGEKITHLGNNTYDTPIGRVKFMENDGKTLLATDFSQTYIRVNHLESKGVAFIVTLSFMISTLINVIALLVLLFRKKSWSKLSAFVLLVQIISFLVIGILIFKGIMAYALLVNVIYLKMVAWVFLVTTLVNLSSIITMKFKNRKIPLVYISLIHNVVSIAFCAILFNYNLLL